jgi:Zn-dependent protease with chaperone function
MKPVFGLAIASAIPVVMFALWAEYFSEDWRKSRESREDEEELEVSIARVRLAGLLATTLQLVLFLATSGIRHEDSLAGVAGIWITLAALVTQRIHQASLERMLLEGQSAATTAQLKNPSPLAGPTLLWAFAGVAIYLGILGASLFSTAVAIAVFKWTGLKAMAAVAVGTMSGYTAALASNFLVSPWILGKMLPSKALENGPEFGRISEYFGASGVPLPEIRVLAPDAPLRSSNAWVSGVSWAARWIRPTLWLTPALLELLDERELEAVVKHEIIHLRKNHLTQRFLLAWSMSILVLFTVAAAMGLSVILPAAQVGPILPAFSLFLAVAMVWGSIRGLEEQSRNHELEADHLCVMELGASAGALASAIRKVDAANPAASAALARSHPTLELRLRALEPLVIEERKHLASSLSRDQNKAA